MGKQKQQQYQRRGKKEVPSKTIQNLANQNLAEQLDRAAATIAQSTAQMHVLHAQWRKYLTVISYMVVLLSMHQMHSLSSACIQDIQAVNSLQRPSQQDALMISGSQAAMLVVRDAAVSILGFLMASLLSLFMRSVKEGGGTDFSHPLFLTAQACIVPILILQFYNRSNISADTTDASLSCLDDASLTEGVELPSLLLQPAVNKTLPPALILHAILTLSLWFMTNQRAQLLKNAAAVEELQAELMQAVAAAANNGATNKKKQ
jgi:hypothetical protein